MERHTLAVTRFASGTAFAIAIAGSFLPWARNDWYSRLGTGDGGDGVLTALLGLGGVLISLFGKRAQTFLWAVIGGAVGFSIGLINYLDITGKVFDGQRAVEVGEGLYVTMVAHAAAGLIAIGCALTAFLVERRGEMAAPVQEERAVHHPGRLEIIAVTGFLLVALGSFLPWFAFGNGTLTQSGIDGGDGRITLVLAVVGGTFLLAGTSSAGRLWAAAAAGLAFLVGLVNFMDVAGDLNSVLEAEAPVGNGVYVTMVGALAAAVASAALSHHPAALPTIPRAPRAPGVF